MGLINYTSPKNDAYQRVGATDKPSLHQSLHRFESHPFHTADGERDRIKATKAEPGCRFVEPIR